MVDWAVCLLVTVGIVSVLILEMKALDLGYNGKILRIVILAIGLMVGGAVGFEFGLG